jgi:CRISPR-associated endonuclease Csn1
MNYRLGLDLGSTSIGWCLLQLDQENNPQSVLDMGVRIFSDGREDQSKEPLAVGRRNARSIRRNFDRRERRQKRLMSLLMQFNLMPKDEMARKDLEKLNPYEIRAKAVNQKISLYELGRALFHINQRRGFKSNRKTDKRENDKSNMKIAIEDLRLKLMQTNSKSLGEYMWKSMQKHEPVRVRTQMVKNKAEYNFYPDRKMYQEEVKAILDFQKKFYPELTQETCERITDIIFYQRNLKPVQVGKCRFEYSKHRARLAYAETQKFRILQEVNNLELIESMEGDPQLTNEDRQKIIKSLLSFPKRTFSQLRALLKLPRDCRFNLESEKRSELLGDTTSVLLSDDKCFGSRWFGFSSDEKNKIIDLIFDTQDPDELIEKLVLDYDLDADSAENCANSNLTEGYGSLSIDAIRKILPFLEQGFLYHDAVIKAGYDSHSDFRTGQVYDKLPYYGQVLPNNVMGGTYAPEDKEFPEKYFGKINNPSVHIALNQTRKLVNGLIERYGTPEQIVIELARDLKEPGSVINQEQADNAKQNKRINSELKKLGVKESYRNRMLYKLWEDLASDPVKRCCPFSGSQISETDIFSGSFEEEHLLPFSRSYNDGRANKVLSSRYANRQKSNQTPFEAFGHTPEWKDILARAQNLPANKRWRFQEDAWEIAKGKGEDIIARMLNDTRYMSKITKAYLSAVFDNEKGKSKVWAIPGQMTALLRAKWGLNDLLGDEDGAKDRTDHRHHAIDAFVVACSDRSAFQKLSAAANKIEGTQALREKRHKLVQDMQEPFPHYLSQISKRIDTLVVSHRPDHGGVFKAIHASKPYTVGKLHKETAYAVLGKGQKKGTVIVAERVPIGSFEKFDSLDEIAHPVIREELKQRLKDLAPKSVEWKAALAEYSKQTGVRRLRIHYEKQEESLVGIKQPLDRGPVETRGQVYKYYAMGSNYCADIYCPDKGKKAGKWHCEIIPTFYAHQKNFIPQWRKENPTAKLIMRLQIDDMVAYEEDDKTMIVRVRKLNAPDKVVFVDHLKAKLGVNEGWAASANQMQLKNLRKISVDIMGRVRDPKKKVR